MTNQSHVILLQANCQRQQETFRTLQPPLYAFYVCFSLIKRSPRPFMTGIISSLVVEPLLRRARRLSSPAASSDTNYAEFPPTLQRIFPTGDNNTKGIAVMSGEGQSGQGHSGLGQSSRYTSRASGFAPPLRPLDSNNHPLGNESFLQPGHVREGHGDGDVLQRSQTQSPVSTDSTAPRHRRNGRTSSERASRNSFEMGAIKGQLALPEDDGMGELRRRIHSIRDLDISNTQRAQLIHTVMTETYYKFRGRLGGDSNSTEPSPSNNRIPGHSEAPTTDGEEPSIQSPIDTAPAAPFAQPSNPYNLTREDLAPTYFPKVEADPTVGDGEDLETEEFEEARLGCEHYKRNVKLQCYTCKKWYTCRFCHDEVENHHLIRQKTENMLCMLCGHAQSASQWCEACDEQAAQYYCSVCKLWDNDGKKNIYHCNDCGICRIGQGLGKDFFHCKVCIIHPRRF